MRWSPFSWRSGVKIQMKGTAKAKKVLRQVRGSRDPGPGCPRVQPSLTYASRRPLRRTHSISTSRISARWRPGSRRMMPHERSKRSR